MATSGQITALLTVRDYVLAAMQLLGVIAPGDDIEADEADSAMRFMSSMLKAWQADGCNLWRDDEVDITWPADTPQCDLSPNVIDVISARYVQSTTYERWLDRWERGAYQSLPNKIAAGFPTMFVFIKTRGNPQMAVWPVPSSEITIRANVARVTEDVTDVDQTIDIPQEWAECVYYNLAARMAGTMGANPNIARDVNDKAREMYVRMSSFDRPGSYTMEAW